MAYRFSHILRVRYAETDQMGVVYHARYLDWFEIGRTEMLRQAGMNYRKLEEDQGLLLPVVDATLQYKQPARYDDEVAVNVRVEEFSAVRLEFAYEVTRCEDGQLLVTGTTKHMWVNRHWKPVRIDRHVPELYALLGRICRTEDGPGQ